MIKKAPRFFAVVLIMQAVLFVACKKDVETKQGKPVVVNYNNNLQEIDGFGLSGAFRQARNLMNFPEAKQKQVLDLLFSTEKGAGFSIVRNMVGNSGTWGNEIDGPGKSIEPKEGTWDWTGDEDQIWFMNQAKKYGVNRFVSTVWSPPAWMKTNNSVKDGGSLRKDKYRAYAEYLTQYILGYRKHHNIDIYAISLANEPEYKAGYCSCIWTGEQFRDFIKKDLRPVFLKNRVTSKVIIGETMLWSEAVTIDAVNDPAAAKGVDIVAAHGYKGAPAAFFNAKAKNKKVWQTEMSYFEKNDPSIDDGIQWAITLHKYLTRPEVNAWFYWWGMSYKKNGEALINMDLKKGSYVVSKRLYTLGQYARFIRPGFVRVESRTKPFPFVFSTTYKDPQSKKLVIVVINAGLYKVSLDYSFNDFSAKSFTTYLTDSETNLEKSGTIETDNNRLSLVVEPRTVYTFVSND